MDTTLIRNLFGAALPVVAIDSPSAEELNALERIYFDVGRRLKLPVFAFDLAAGLRKVTSAQEVRYHTHDGNLFDGEPVSADNFLWTADPEHDPTAQQLIETRAEVSGIAFEPIETNFKHPLLNIFQHIERFDKNGIFVLIDIHPFFGWRSHGSRVQALLKALSKRPKTVAQADCFAGSRHSARG